MNSLYALMVGIDAYAERPLRGCRNDVVAALAFLRSRVEDLHPVELHDGAATRAAVVDGLRHHLGRAGPGDTALFWFAGHGSEVITPPVNTLVCADSRAGQPDLWDNELALLLGAIAARGAHVVAVLDCSHASSVRREMPEAAARVRRLDPPAAGQPLPELRDFPPPDAYVTLAASRENEPAYELPDGDNVPHGVFSWALLRALNTLGPAATSRELLTAARCLVEDRVSFQVPRLSPARPGPADQPFLGTGIALPHATMTLLNRGSGWEIDAGSCHGLPATGGELRVAVLGSRPARPARITAVLTGHSEAEPIGWEPRPDRQYPVVLTDLPMPPATVAIGGSDDGDPGTEDAVAAALARAVHVRPAAHAGDVPELRVHASRPGYVEIRGSDEVLLTAPIEVPDLAACAGRTVRTLEHIARWRRLKALSNPRSALAGAVRLEIFEAGPGDSGVPAGRAPLPADGSGMIRLAYRHTLAGLVAPSVFVRLSNVSAGPLYCVLLDLTDGYRVHAGLFPGAEIAAGGCGWALDGRRIAVNLAPHVAAEPGATGRDWLQLVVAGRQFSPRPFTLGRLDMVAEHPARPAPTGLGGVLERLGRSALYREAGRAEPDEVYDWATTVVPLLTEITDPSRTGP